MEPKGNVIKTSTQAIDRINHVIKLEGAKITTNQPEDPQNYHPFVEKIIRDETGQLLTRVRNELETVEYDKLFAEQNRGALDFFIKDNHLRLLGPADPLIPSGVPKIRGKTGSRYHKKADNEKDSKALGLALAEIESLRPEANLLPLLLKGFTCWSKTLRKIDQTKNQGNQSSEQIFVIYPEIKLSILYDDTKNMFFTSISEERYYFSDLV